MSHIIAAVSFPHTKYQKEVRKRKQKMINKRFRNAGKKN